MKFKDKFIIINKSKRPTKEGLFEKGYSKTAYVELQKNKRKQKHNKNMATSKPAIITSIILITLLITVGLNNSSLEKPSVDKLLIPTKIIHTNNSTIIIEPYKYIQNGKKKIIIAETKYYHKTLRG